MRRRVVAAITASAATGAGDAKALLPWAGTTRLRAIAREVCASPCERVAVVLGATPGRTATAVEGLPVCTLPNVLWSEGVASAIRCSIAWALRCGADGLLLVDGDQARVDRAHVDSLLAAFRTTRAPVASYVCGDVCVPAVFGVESFAKLAQLTGNRDARDVLRLTPIVKALPWPEGTIERAIDDAIDGALDSMIACALDVSAIPQDATATRVGSPHTSPEPVDSEPVVPAACSTP